MILFCLRNEKIHKKKIVLCSAFMTSESLSCHFMTNKVVWGHILNEMTIFNELFFKYYNVFTLKKNNRAAGIILILKKVEHST